ncbi:pleiotropic drug resistance protein 1-like isoform X1 [Salvia hispanica]|uniref:pleiotropic drug resistance protein 1-like isoform X1 n=1 Tax=Salvia hispanica TaxID=49212 RepID=UPI00200982F1|nr:pleiotropic drug resistance protein 1-like isoform X1 [Salvia hispanica]
MDMSESFRRNSSLWRNNGLQMFSTSSRGEDDDEEALIWAAIERLPTFDRLRRGILVGSEGGFGEIDDVRNLEFQERKNLLDRLVRDAREDNEKFLLKLKNRIDAVGIDLPSIEVRFENLKVEAEAYVGRRSLPTLINFFANIFEELSSYTRVLSTRKRPFTILKDINGILKPGRMTLLLGPPSSGKTTLLLTLAGMPHPDMKVKGNVTYNGHELKEFVPQRSAAYISQHDVHLGEMTVRETLAFSARCQGVGTNLEMLAELSRREKEANIRPDPDVDIYMKAAYLKGQEISIVTDYILKILGLDMCADTAVGDDMTRGISGGQKKRVTLGEMLVGPAKAFFMDEITTGLDSSTAYQVVNCIRESTHILKGTVLMSLLQPEPETYELFDDIMLISEGQIVYQGPREHVIGFFRSMGFKCPERKGVADFLQEVTSRRDQWQYWADKDRLYRFVTAREFAESFRSFHVGQRLTADLAIPFDKRESHPAALTTKHSGVSRKEILKACASRELLLMKRNSFMYIFRLFQQCFMAFVTMTLFFRTKMRRDSLVDGRKFASAIYFVLVTVMFGGLAEMVMGILRLPVFYRQRNFFFFPAWAYVLPQWIFSIPLNAFEMLVFTVLTYYEIGFDANFGRCVKYYLLLLMLLQASTSLFRLIGAIGRDMIVAFLYAYFILLLVMSLCGFVLPRGAIKNWWIWGYYISPMMYAENALMVNEFRGHSWRHASPDANMSLGVEVLKSQGYFPGSYWYWIGIGALIGMAFLFYSCYILALTYLNPMGRSQTILPEDENEVLTDKNERKEEGKKRDVVLPFEPHSMAFDDVKYSVDMPQEMKNQGANEDRLVLLKGVSGVFRPGVLTALMGVSGAGKTTLMDVLAGRKTGGYIEGNITVSGYPKKQETFARISGYCEQNDIHSPCVTVYESLLFSAWLRLPPEVNSATRKLFVENVMELVELTPIRDGLVGLPGVSGLSTEQRKRLTIAVELVANPSIIFMDEPTSGLDARAAQIVMRTVRNTVETGRTVVCTIHQPSIDIFEAFDELFLMKRGGQEIYVGPVGQHSCNLIHYFEAIQGTQKIRDGYNPATWMLEVSSSSQEQILGIDFAEIYRNSELYRCNKALVKELSTPRPGTKDLHFQTKYSQPFFTQCLACLWKQHWSYWRNPTYSAVRMVYTVFLAIMFGLLFWDLGSKRGSYQDILNAMGSMYSSVFFLGVQIATSVQPVVVVERTVFYRERAAGLYSALPYALGQMVMEIPYCFGQAVVYGLIVYAMIGFEWTAAKFFWFLYFMFFTLLYFVFYGMMAVAMTPNHHIANIVSYTFYGIWNVFSGFIVSRPLTPVWWRWYHWVNPVAWTVYGLSASQFGDVTDQFASGQSVREFVRSYFGFRHDFIGVAVAVVAGFGVVFAVTFAFAIKVFNYQRR